MKISPTRQQESAEPSVMPRGAPLCPPAWIKLLAAMVYAAAPGLAADALSARLQGDSLYLVAPGLDIMRGPALERLKNGAAVAFDFHVVLSVGSRTSVRKPSFERFQVSYDLWEEKFSVAGMRPKVATSGLTARGVPAWCLEHIALPITDLTKDTPFWLRLEVRVVEKKNDTSWLDPSVLDLAKLIELLSRPAREETNRWSLESGPLHLSDLR